MEYWIHDCAMCLGRTIYRYDGTPPPAVIHGGCGHIVPVDLMLVVDGGVIMAFNERQEA